MDFYFLSGSFVEVQFPRISCLLAVLHGVVLYSQQSVVSRAATEPFSALEDHPEDIELLCIRIPALSCFCCGFDGRLNGLGSLISSSFDQARLVISFYLGPPESGDEFGMGNGLVHKDFIN